MITYRVRQDNTSWSRYPKHFFAHSVNLRTVETSELAAIIQSNCSVKRSDVMAVLIELGETVQQLLADSHRVHIDGLGWLNDARKARLRRAAEKPMRKKMGREEKKWRNT